MPDTGFVSAYRARAAFESTRLRRRMATRTVAGGRARSARPPERSTPPKPRPRQC